MAWVTVSGPLGNGPVRKFHDWYSRALSAELPLPERAALATADAAGRPSVRFVLVRAYDQRGLVFFTNYESRKGSDLAANPCAALAFYWHQLGLQIRVEGEVEMLETELSDRYFASRPPGNRAAAIVSPQSTAIDNYDDLHKELEGLLGNGADTLTRPANWGGYRLKPDNFEFWANKAHRLHMREYWQYRDGNWAQSLLAP